MVLVLYNEPENLVAECLKSLIEQEKVFLDVMVLNQNRNKREDYLSIVKKFENKVGKNFNILFEEILDISLGYARKCGLEKSDNKLVAFTDPDCMVDKYWAYNLGKTFRIKENVGVVTGKIEPIWEINSPKFFQKPNYFKRFYSLYNQGKTLQRAKDITGANLCIDYSKFEKNPFKETLGRREGKLVGGEDTAIMKEAKKAGLKILYNPSALVHHRIPQERTSLSWIMKRMFYGGYSSGLKRKSPDPSYVDKNLYDWLILPFYSFLYTYGYCIGTLLKKLRLISNLFIKNHKN